MKKILIAVIAVLALFTLAQGFAAMTDAEWQRLTDKALDDYYYGRNEQAVAGAREALKAAEELFGPDDLKVVGSVDNLATYLVAIGKVEEAEVHYGRALSMLKKKLPPDDHYLAIFMDYLAVFYDKIGKVDYAKELRQHASDIRFGRIKAPASAGVSEGALGTAEIINPDIKKKE